MNVELLPEAEPQATAAVEAAIERAALAPAPGHPAYDAPWREAALAEGAEGHQSFGD